MRLYQSVSGATTLRLAYDGLDRIAEYNGSNALQRRYVHGPNADEPLVWYEGSGTSDRRFLSSDERGSIISVTNSSGTLLGINKYDEFGNPQSGNLGAFGYTGQAWLPTMGVWYYKARVYEPDLGRFLQTDPIGMAGGVNLYAYVGNDPVNFIDPNGTCMILNWVTHVYNGNTGKDLGADPVHPGSGVDRIGCDSGGLASFNVSLVDNGEGGTDAEIVVTGQRSKKVSQCMIGFLNSRGLTDKSLEGLVFIRGMSYDLVTREAYRSGASAITRGNTIYVRSSSWNSVTNAFAGSTFFEEILHSVQYSRSGTLSFNAMYLLGGAMAAISGIKGGYPNHIEIEAKIFASKLWNDYRSLPSAKRC